MPPSPRRLTAAPPFVGIAGMALSSGPAGGHEEAASLAQVAFSPVWTGVDRLPAPLEALLLG